MSESCVEILEETLVPRLIWTGGLTSLDTSRGPFPQQSGCERDPEFDASRAVDTEIPGLERKSDFLALA